MSWRALIELLRAELPAEAERVEKRILSELSGVRLSIPGRPRPVVTDRDIDAALAKYGYNIDRTADALGVHKATLYRRLNARRRPDPQPAQPGVYRGRLIR